MKKQNSTRKGGKTWLIVVLVLSLCGKGEVRDTDCAMSGLASKVIGGGGWRIGTVLYCTTYQND
jgi:hypothetical protein